MKTVGIIKAYEQGVLGLFRHKTTNPSKIQQTVAKTPIKPADNSYLRRMGLSAREINKASKHWFA